MNGRVSTTLGTKYLVGAIGEDFVDVHVVRRPRTGLIHIDDEMLAVFAGQNFVSRLHDRVCQLGLEPAGLLMCERRCALDANCGIDKSR